MSRRTCFENHAKKTFRLICFFSNKIKHDYVFRKKITVARRVALLSSIVEYKGKEKKVFEPTTKKKVTKWKRKENARRMLDRAERKTKTIVLTIEKEIYIYYDLKKISA